MGLRRELRARFANRTEKKNKVWQAVADTFNEEMRRRYPQYDVRSVLHLRHKWDNQIRAAFISYKKVVFSNTNRMGNPRVSAGAG